MSLISGIRVYGRGAFQHPKVKRAVWMVLFLLVLDLTLVVFWAGPAAIRHHQLLGGIEDYNRAKQEALDARETADNYGLFASRMGELEAKWKTPANQSGLIQSLTGLAEQNGLQVVSQDFDAGDSKGGVMFKQTLSLVGTYRQLRHFLAGLEDLPHLTIVEQARLEKAGEEGNRLRAVLQLCTYHKPAGKRP